MIPHQLNKFFDEVLVVEFETVTRDGEPQEPICLTAKELGSGRVINLIAEDLKRALQAPYRVDDRILFVGYAMNNVLGCHIALGWPIPSRIIDLYAEFRWMTNGHRSAADAGFLDALLCFGIGCLDDDTKSSISDPYKLPLGIPTLERRPPPQRSMRNVDAIELLLTKMAPQLDLPRALFRGRYTAALARIQANGVPIDTETLTTLRKNWKKIHTRLIEDTHSGYGVYDGQAFNYSKFEKFLEDHAIAWPRNESAQLDLSDQTFRDLAKIHPLVRPLQELRATLSKLRPEALTVGSDARNRCDLSPFRSKTGRNQPSTSKYVFGPAVWIRSLIKPPPGMGLAYLDWSQQEFGIGAALSKDQQMMRAYETGDPYLGFAIQAGAVPQGATKHTHKKEREQFKHCALAVLYGMGGRSLAAKIGRPNFVGDDLLRLHRRTYPTFWKWSDSAVANAVMFGRLQSTLGWQILIGSEVNCRSLANFPMQANGAEMLQLACSLATERGIRICAPVHDAVLIEAPITGLGAAVALMQDCMREASKVLLNGFELRTEAEIVAFPNRYMDERGTVMWQLITKILAELKPDS